MDQSASMQDQDEVWLAKLALLGCTVDQYEGFYFVYVGGRITLCGERLPELTLQMVDNFKKGLYQ